MSSLQKAKNKVARKAKRLSATFSLVPPFSMLSPPTHSILPPPQPPPGPHVAADGTDLTIPDTLQKGTELTKVSDKSKKRLVFRLDPDEGQILYKSRKRGIVPIEAIKEIRTGANTSYYRSQFRAPKDWESRWLTVIYILDGSYKTLHMVADTRDVLKLWETSLRKLHLIRQGLMTGLGNVDLRNTIWERQYWKGADEEGDQKLDFDDIERLCKRLNVSLTVPQLREMFEKADSQKLGYLDYDGFKRFVKSLKYRPELDTIYKSVATGPGGKLDFNAFKKLMIESQKSALSEDDLKSLFTKYIDQQEQPTNDAVMSLDQFSSFLLSSDNGVFSEYGKPIWQDMTRPLSDYYISSSHNTYLVGHQLVGVSTIEGYIRALLHSCRSVELDVYDGDREPMIYHGNTLTSKVSLRDICHAIAKYAFVTSPYPLLISAEVHCGIRQQDKLVDIMVEVFGDSLVQAPVENRPKLEKLPSPDELKHKILLKAKNQYVVAQLAEKQALRTRTPAQEDRLAVLLNFTSSSSSSSSSSDDDDGNDNNNNNNNGKEGEYAGNLSQGLKAQWTKLRRKATPSPSHSASGISPSPSTPPTEHEKLKMSFRLAALLVYTVGVKCHGIGAHASVNYEPEHIFSLSENAVNRVIKVAGSMKELIQHTQTNLVRIYPKGTRFSSTNYSPHRYWAAGAQVVAINWQTFDLGYTINQAMFQRNSRCGYVLKPLALRAEGAALLSKHTKHFFDATVISAQQLPRFRDSSGQEIIEKSIVDPFVEVTLHIPDWSSSPFLPPSNTSSKAYKYKPATDANSSGLPTGIGTGAGAAGTSSARRVSVRTRTIRNNGFNPVWQETLSIPFDCVGGLEGGMRDLIFVEFAVREDGSGDSGVPIAVYCAPLSTFEFGYRHLPLHDMELSQHMFSTLFVQIGITDVQ